jgi:hypothetical protein
MWNLKKGKTLTSRKKNDAYQRLGVGEGGSGE